MGSKIERSHHQIRQKLPQVLNCLDCNKKSENASNL